MTDNEKLVWAAAFSAALEAGRGEQTAALKAAIAVRCLRNIDRLALDNVDTDARRMVDAMQIDIRTAQINPYK